MLQQTLATFIYLNKLAMTAAFGAVKFNERIE